MSPSTFSRTASAVALLASTASAAWSASSTQNVAMYWGQGNNQLALSEVCADPSIDVVNIAFVNGFPLKRGDYPATNFGNACWGTYFQHPTDPSQDNKLLKDCPSIEPGIAVCHANGKKVLLSLGGGYPTDYYIPSTDVATYFAEFLIGAFGPPGTTLAAGKPRPFGNAAVDGFDLDLEAEASQVPAGGISANYAFFVNELKRLQSSLLISSAPQCQVPDVRLADAISKADFDMIFTQFYNTEDCSARLGYQQINQASTGFTFNTWADWLKANSKNKKVKLYLGLAAGPDGLPTNKNDYLKPDEANALITKWKAQYNDIFGGVMLWEATVSARNVVNCHSYAYWIKTTLQGKFTSSYKACVSSSSVQPSSTKASSSSASSTKASSSASNTKASSSASSTKVSSSSASSTKASSSSASSTKASSSSASSTKASSSSASSTKASSSSASSTKASSSASSASSSGYPASSPTASSSASSSKVSSSSASSASSSGYPASSPTASSSGSSTKASSSSASSASSSGYPASTSAGSSSASQSVASSSSAPAISSSGSTIYPASTPSPSVGYPISVPTIIYQHANTKGVYPHSSLDLAYPSQSSSATWPSYNNASTPCSTSTKTSSTPAGYYAASSTPGYPVYGASSSPAPGYPVYPASSPVKAYDAYPASVTSKAGQNYPSYPASSTTKVITTTYVDSCETGVTTKTETITKTVCAKCQDSVTSIYVCGAGKCGPSVVTITITRPYSPATNVPVKPSSPPTYGGDKPQPPAQPSSPPTYGGDKPQPPAQPSNPPTYGGNKSAPPAQPSVPAKPKSTTVSIVYITKIPVPVVPVSSVKYTPIPYPSAPAKNGTFSYPVKPTGTGAVPSKATGYSPPQFTGAAAQVSVGMTGLLAVVAGLMAL